jgi:hypothetical protein
MKPLVTPGVAGLGPRTVVGLCVAILAVFTLAPRVGLAGSSPSTPRPSTPPVVRVVMPDTDHSVDELVHLVRQAAREVPDTRPDRALQVIFTDALPAEHDQPLLGGYQTGSTVWVRTGVARPTRTLLHEVAHVVTPGAGHDEPFRSVYLAAIAVVYDEQTAAREARRLAWVNDRCYLADSCPELDRGP